MIWEALLPLLLVLTSLVPGILIFFLKDSAQGVRTAINLAGAVTKLVLVGVLVVGVYNGTLYETRLPLLPGIDLVLRADALSLLFIMLSASLWLVTTLYAIGYLDGSPNRSRFFGFFSLCVSATMGIALAGNLLTFLIFYEFLTLCTYPLVAHKGYAESLRGGRTYLIYTLIAGSALLLAVVGIYALAGPVEFTSGGVLGGLATEQPGLLQFLFLLFMIGVGVKAAIVPLHGWLPRAMVAPAPVSALLHAVAVVKAGAFGVLRIVYDLYGIETAGALGVLDPLLIVACATVLLGSVLALFQDDLKKRLAYSTVSQVSYVIIGAALFGPVGTLGGLLHLVHQGVMKITLFFGAGSYAETLGIYRVSQMNGVGRRMPLTTAAFTLGALGMIGIPPTAGFISKWYLGAGALADGYDGVLVVLLISSLLNAAYFLPILYRAWFKRPPEHWPEEHPDWPKETRWLLLAPPVITGVFSLLLGLFANLPIGLLRWVELIIAREYPL